MSQRRWILTTALYVSFFSGFDNFGRRATCLLSWCGARKRRATRHGDVRTAFTHGSGSSKHVSPADQCRTNVGVRAFDGFDLVGLGAWREHGRGGFNIVDGNGGRGHRTAQNLDLISLGARREQWFSGEGRKCKRRNDRTEEENFRICIHIQFLFWFWHRFVAVSKVLPR